MDTRMVSAIAGLAGALAWALCPAAHASVQVVDDSGATVTLKAPAARIVSLAPHATELLFAAGAGDRIVGAVEFSDFPEAAKRIPRVGSSAQLDMERIVGLAPDLVVVWLNGSSAARLDKVRALGVPIFYSEPRTLADIPATLRRFGTLAATESPARAAADGFARQAAALRATYAQSSPVTVFWQIWARPLLTINGRHLISDVISLCGGANVFEGLGPLVPAVSIEAVVAADPEAIVTTSNDATAGRDDGLDAWHKLRNLRATSRRNLIVLNAETIHRQSPRILEGVAALCEALESVRARRTR